MAVDQPTQNTPESAYVSPYVGATSADYAATHRTRVRRLIIWSIVVSLLLGGALLITDGNIIAPISLLAVIALMGLMIQYPTIILPITLAGTCLFEQNLLGFKDSVTDRVPLFWDINTVIQIYGHHDTHVVPFSLFEILFVMAVASWLIRGVYERSLTMTWGKLALPIIGYILCVCYGVAYGVSTGGDYHIALFEARPQFYLLAAYLMALNSGQKAPQQWKAMLWISAICIGIKAILLTGRFFITLGGHTVPEQGVGSHEESFFFDAFLVMLGVLWMAGIEPKLQRLMACLLPFVLIANLANERRVATAALVIAVPILLGLAYVAFANRRKLVVGIFIAVAAISVVYFPIFWNRDGVLAQPARALKSQFSPDWRDQSSDIYREAEDANLMYTMRTSPVIGYGYGKRLILFVQMVDLSNIDPLIMYRTHDQILWVWMRIGTIGFFFFWIMMAAILMRAASTVRMPSQGAVIDPRRDRLTVAAAVFTAVLTVMLLLFGLYDMQLSSIRDMLFEGFWVGMMCSFIAQQAPVKSLSPIYTPARRISPAQSASLLPEGSRR
jgi:hypothetical protein